MIKHLEWSEGLSPRENHTDLASVRDYCMFKATYSSLFIPSVPYRKQLWWVLCPPLPNCRAVVSMSGKAEFGKVWIASKRVAAIISQSKGGVKRGREQAKRSWEATTTGSLNQGCWAVRAQARAPSCSWPLREAQNLSSIFQTLYLLHHKLNSRSAISKIFTYLC